MGGGVYANNTKAPIDCNTTAMISYETVKGNESISPK